MSTKFTEKKSREHAGKRLGDVDAVRSSCGSMRPDGEEGGRGGTLSSRAFTY